MKPGMMAYKSSFKEPPFSANGAYIHTKVVTAPLTIPAMAATRLMFFHINENKTSGPKAAPNPAQALLTSEWKNIDGRERRYYTISALGDEVLAQLTLDWQNLNTSLSALLENT